MATEIERKFLIAGDFKSEAFDHKVIKQGYIIPEAEGRSVRIRRKGNKGFITIKGPTSENGLSRYEWEKEIALEEAEELLKLCNPNYVDKVRYLVKAGQHTFEVDEFHGLNEGLVMAEVELGSEEEEFMRPSWLGKEVTGDARYYNSSLARFPYLEWKDSE